MVPAVADLFLVRPLAWINDSEADALSADHIVGAIDGRAQTSTKPVIANPCPANLHLWVFGPALRALARRRMRSYLSLLAPERAEAPRHSPPHSRFRPSSPA